MKMSTPNRMRLLKKLKHYPEWGQYGGYLLPIETVYISELVGYKSCDWYENAKKMVKIGDSRPFWVYFNTEGVDLPQVL